VLHAHGISDPGCIRTTNEDCFSIDEELQLLVVADGLGGHKAGEVAARLAVDSVVEYVRESAAPPRGDRWPFGFDPSLSETGNRVRTAIHLAHMRILEASMTADAYRGMCTTIVCALVERGRLAVGHVGDSRLYLLKGSELRALTRDDSWTPALQTRLPRSEPAETDRWRNALTNVVGGRRGTHVHVSEASLVGGEIVVLLTDGVHGVLDDRWLRRILRVSDDERQMASGLVEAALARGSRDNCTAVVATYVAQAPLITRARRHEDPKGSEIGSS
jgi:serine/threonine protein phosphatase PrpC